MRILEQINRISDLADRLEKVEDNAGKNDEVLKTLGELELRLQRAEENVRHNNEVLKTLGELELRLQRVEENVRHNNHALSQLPESEVYSQISAKMEAFKKRVDRMEQIIATGQVQGQSSTVAVGRRDDGDAYGDIDYFDFENHFRGSRETVMERQREYLPYFKGKKAVLDLGCGRGEFLELLGKNRIPAKGVDLYDEFVCYCQGKGLDVVQADAIDYLAQSAMVDGIFAGQLVEHLSISQIIALCANAFEKLEKGGYLILETPNPMSLAIYTHSFYMDPSHQKPVHPYTLQYLVQKVGFGKVEILFTRNSRLSEHFPIIKGEGIENADEFNQNLCIMAEYMYGSQDYAIIAQK